MTSLIVEVKFQLQNLIDDGEMRDEERATPGVSSLLAGEAPTLAQLAGVCKHVLAWDSLSFLDVLQVDNTGDIRAEPTQAGWARLRSLGLAGVVDFSDWDT